MEFDKTKVYTAQNADEIKIGSKGYLADNIAELKRCVFNGDKEYFFTIKEIATEDENYRFLADNYSDNEVSWNLFYLVEEPKENRFRPYSNPDEMIEDFKKRYSSYGGWSGNGNPMYNPMIWIKSKATEFRHLITDYDDNDNCGHCNRSCIWIGSISIGFKELHENYTYIDGSPCGIKKE